MDVLQVCANNGGFLRTTDLCNFRLICTHARKLVPKDLLNPDKACSRSLGCLEELKRVHEFLGFPLNSDVYTQAVALNNMEIIGYLHEKNCPLYQTDDFQICDYCYCYRDCVCDSVSDTGIRKFTSQIGNWHTVTRKFTCQPNININIHQENVEPLLGPQPGEIYDDFRARTVSA